MVKIFEIDFLIENDILQFKLTEYEFWISNFFIEIQALDKKIKYYQWREKFDVLNDVKINQMTLK